MKTYSHQPNKPVLFIKSKYCVSAMLGSPGATSSNPLLPLTIIICAVLCLTLTSIGCQGFSATGGPGKLANPNLLSATTGQSKDLVKVNAVLIAPIVTDPGVKISKVEQEAYSDDLAQVLTQELSLVIQTTKDKTSKDIGASSSPKIIATKDSPATIDSKEGLLAYAKKKNLDSVLYTTLHNYVEREGSAVGVTQAASIYFTCTLVRVSDGAEIWSANYQFKDKALSDNLFQVRDRLFQSKEGLPSETGLGYKSARDLLLNGFREVATKLSQARTEQFLR